MQTSREPSITPDSPILAALRRAQTRHRLFAHLLPKESEVDTPHQTATARQTVIVAVSGGADSVCLLHALYTVRHTWRLDLHVAHLDHALRPQSADDAAFVQALAAQLNLAWHTQRLHEGALDGHPDGPEAAARQARYRFLAQVADHVTPAHQTPCLALAHHLDDQAETVLLNLARGSGLAGLGGMAWTRDLPATQFLAECSHSTLRLLRPFLGLRRAQIVDALTRMGQSWREDASNRDPRYLRNRIRAGVLPALAALNPQIHVTLARNAHIAAGDAARLARMDRATLAALLLQADPPQAITDLQQARTAQRLVLDLEQLNRLDWATRRGVLRQALACFAVDGRDLGFEHMESLLEQLAPQAQPPADPGPHPLAGGLAWTLFPARFPVDSRSVLDAPQPPRLSLHLEQALPWLPPFPNLGTATAQTVPVPVPVPGELASDATWLLVASVHTAAELAATQPHTGPKWPRTLSPWACYLDLDAIAPSKNAPDEHVPLLTLATPQPGMRLAPLGMDGHTKSVGDLFTDAKIHPCLRPGWPVIQTRTNRAEPSEPTLLWVCGLAISHHARITLATRRVLHLRWERRA